MAERANILILDDFEDLLELLQVIIEKHCDRTALTARKLSEVVALGEKALNCEIALLDINLGPDEPDGVDVYRWLRSNHFAGPIYFLTGHGQSYPAVAEALRLGDAKVLTKPVPPDELIRIVRGACERRRINV